MQQLANLAIHFPFHQRSFQKLARDYGRPFAHIWNVCFYRIKLKESISRASNYDLLANT